MRSAIQKAGGPKVKGYPSIAALKPSYAIGFLKDPELLPLCATNEEHGGLRCCNEDEGWPLGVAFQREAPNRPLLLRPKGVVVSEWEPTAKPW
jgi:hypothetical protein